MVLRIMSADDWEAVKEIYLLGIATGNATLQTEAPPWEDWDKDHLPFGRLVALIDSKIVGWCALSPVSSRCVYSGLAEVSVYIHTDYLRKGIGLVLLTKLVEESEANGIWTLQAGIISENTASIKLHEKAGFRIVGHREKLGKLHGVWRDAILLEKRSTVVV